MIDDVRPLVNAAKLLKERGAYTIYVIATHGLLSSNAPAQIQDSFIDEVSLILFALLNATAIFIPGI